MDFTFVLVNEKVVSDPIRLVPNGVTHYAKELHGPVDGASDISRQVPVHDNIGWAAELSRSGGRFSIHFIQSNSTSDFFRQLAYLHHM
jgi:hypothetical protein